MQNFHTKIHDATWKSWLCVGIADRICFKRVLSHDEAQKSLAILAHLMLISFDYNSDT